MQKYPEHSEHSEHQEHPEHPEHPEYITRTIPDNETLKTQAIENRKIDTILYIAKEFPDAQIPTKNHEDDAGLDVYAYEDCLIPANGHGRVRTGIRIMTTYGYRWNFSPRSGLGYVKLIQAYALSIMDPYFHGDTTALVFNHSDTDYTIKKGDRFAQIIINKIPETSLKEVTIEDMENIANGKRGDKKWGSSGV